MVALSLSKIRLLVALCGALCVASPARAQWLLGGFDNPPASQIVDRAASMAQHARFANLTMNVRWCHPEDWDDARATGLQVLLMWPDEFMVGDATAPALDWGIPIIWERPMWSDCTRADGSPLRAVDWYYTVVAHRDQIAGFLLCDECDGNYGGARFPFWTVASLEGMARKLEWNAASLRGIFGVHGWYPPIWVNYTSAWVEGLRRNLPGYRLPYGPDWFSFDAYTPWGNCYGNVTCPQLLQALKLKMRPEQRLVLIPRAFGGSYLGWNPSDYDVATTLYAYLAAMLGDPQIVAMIPFIEWGQGGWGSRPVIGETVKAMGRILTGRQ